jgi:hypothetical protein
MVYQDLTSHKTEILTISVLGLEKSVFEACLPAETLITVFETQGPQPAELHPTFARQY